MNTTQLIRHWSMQGALSDRGLRHGVGSVVDIHAAVGVHAEEPANVATGRPSEDAGVGGLLVKPAGGGDWQPLLAGSA